MKTKLLALLAGASLIFTVLTAGPVSAGTLDMGVGPDQVEIDQSTDGGWSSSQIGISGRPYVTDMFFDGLRIGGGDLPGSENFTNGWRLLVSPNNVCRQGQSPAPGVCYVNPNRVSFNLAYVVNGNTYHDFSGATISNLGLGVDEDSEFEFTINLNDMAQDLGWTWVGGTPTYWKVDGDVVHLKVHPASKPSGDMDNFCSTIPVSTCSTERAADEIFTIEFVMSFDDTLNSVFDGTLFASTDAVIASLETAPGFNPATPDANSITYGMAAPHEFSDGTDRSGTFYALLSHDQLAVFGVSDPATVADSLKITRSSSDSGTFDSSWATWTADTNGTDGQLLTLTNISFSVPKFTVNNGNMVERNVVPKVKVKKSRTIKNLLVDLGILSSNESVPKKAKVTITVKSSSKKICKATKAGIQGLKPGTCKYSVKIKLGNQTANKSGSFKVIK